MWRLAIRPRYAKKRLDVSAHWQLGNHIYLVVSWLKRVNANALIHQRLHDLASQWVRVSSSVVTCPVMIWICLPGMLASWICLLAIVWNQTSKNWRVLEYIQLSPQVLPWNENSQGSGLQPKPATSSPSPAAVPLTLPSCSSLCYFPSLLHSFPCRRTQPHPYPHRCRLPEGTSAVAHRRSAVAHRPSASRCVLV
jgi:hypothetical protein